MSIVHKVDTTDKDTGQAFLLLTNHGIFVVRNFGASVHVFGTSQMGDLEKPAKESCRLLHSMCHSMNDLFVDCPRSRVKPTCECQNGSVSSFWLTAKW